MEEEASGGARERDAVPSVGPADGSTDSPGKEAAASVMKAVKVPETPDFIPYAGNEHSGSAGGSVEAAAPGMQETPDYIRRGATPRHRIARPVEISSGPSSPPAERGAAPAQSIGGARGNDAAGLPALQAESDRCIVQMKQQYGLLLREKEECRRLLEDLMTENEVKTRECREAHESLRDMKMELRRKSMHVGSLAFAVEGQVKEKSRLCQLLEGLSGKFKVLKLEYQNLRQESLEYKNCVLDATQMSTSIQEYVNQYATLEREFKDLKEKFSEEAKERRDLYNKLVEQKGNIRVFCRCRPLNADEEAEGASTTVDFESAKDGELIIRGHASSKKVFKFDSVFSPEEDQEKVFERTAPFATSVLDGFNVCIFAYGQTGTGKTYTMEGIEGARGVNYRTLEELFRIIKEREGLFKYDVTVSVLEVYNEQIHDLLVTGSQPGEATKRLEVRQIAGVHHVPGLVEVRVTSMNEAWEVLQTGSKARVVGSTNANEHSSRSHCIHCVMVNGQNLLNGEFTKSKLWLINLAGGERVAKTDAQGERLKETQNINKSLSALGDVISALATKTQHIPFRNSKLTHLLQDSLSGDSKTLMFVQISPNENDVGETLCSLNFASRVRGIELGQARKQVDVGELSRYKLMVGRAKQDIKDKDAQIKTMAETIQSLEAENKAKDLLTVNLQEKIKELESQLLLERKIARQHVDNNITQDHLRKKHGMKVRRLSVCNGTQQHQPTHPASRRNSLIPLSRRNSLMPLPVAKPLAAATPTPLDKIAEYLSPPMCSRVVSNDKASRSKRISSILRRNLQKKVIIRPTMAAQIGKKASTAAQGTDTARRERRLPVSGAAGHRVQQNRDKERGWNTGTSLRHGLRSSDVRHRGRQVGIFVHLGHGSVALVRGRNARGSGSLRHNL